MGTLDSYGDLSTKERETVSRLVDHMVAVLKITHNPLTELVRFGENTVSLGAHDSDGKPNLNIRITEIVGNPVEVPSKNIQNVFVASFGHRPLIKLLGDAQNFLLPLQYRYLSLYKILELEMRVRGQWDNRLKRLLSKYEDEYKELKISDRTFSNIVHDMRDKCAHIKIGANDHPGIIGLDGPDARIVEALVKMLTRIIAEHLTDKSIGMVFVHRPSEAPRPLHAEETSPSSPKV